MADDAQAASQDDQHVDDQNDQQQDDGGLSPAELQAAIKKLRTENASWRTKHRNTQSQLESLSQKVREYEDRDLANETDLKKKNEALEKALNKERAERENEKKSWRNSRILDKAEALAREAGMHDPDDLKTIVKGRLDDFRVSDDGSIDGLSDVVSELRQQKPYWFKSADAQQNQNQTQQQQNRTVATPTRKDGADGGKDWSKASKDEISSFLRREGVMV